MAPFRHLSIFLTPGALSIISSTNLLKWYLVPNFELSGLPLGVEWQFATSPYPFFSLRT